MADWSVVVGTAVGGVTGVVGTYLASSFQARGELRRVWTEYREQERQRRRDAYSAFLNHLNPLENLETHSMSEDELRGWEARFHELATDMRLLAARDYDEDLGQLSACIGVLWSLIPDEDELDPEELPTFEEAVQAAWATTVGEMWMPRRRELFRRMREDLQPPADPG